MIAEKIPRRKFRQGNNFRARDLFQSVAVFIHCVLFFARLVKLRRGVKLNVIKRKELTLLNVAEHLRLFIDKPVNDVAFFVSLFGGCD